MNQRLATVIASIFALMSCELAQAQTTAMQFNTGYAPGYRYRNPSAGMAGAAYGTAGGVTCAPFYVSGPSDMIASAIGATLTTTDASNYASFAIYSASGNFPGSRVDSTLAQNLARAGGVSGSLGGGTDTLAPGAYFLCAASNSTTAVFVGGSNSGASASSTIGSSTIPAAATQTRYTAVTCLGGSSGCGPTWSSGGSSYIWPSSLASARWWSVASANVPLMVVELSSSSPSAPPQAVAAGYKGVLFNSDFSTATLASQLACARTAQTSPPPWKQGVWWENPVAPCSQINIVADPLTRRNVLDLEWTKTGNAGLGYGDTTIDTFPLAYTNSTPGVVPPHFSFKYGYIETVARVSTTATGVWPAIYMFGDTTFTQAYTAPYYTTSLSYPEFDILEIWGGYSGQQVGTTVAQSTIIDWTASNTQIKKNIAWQGIGAPFDVTQLHTYGYLWTPAQVCMYVDNVPMGKCVATDSVMNSQPVFPILTMTVGCNFNPSDLSCIGGLTRADFYVSRVTIYR